MGFTVVGPQQFLGSGHPESGGNGPAQLGLIESVDGGRSWRGLSLMAAADFHSLESKHGLVYGYDSQTRQLMVSTDKQSWDRRARVAMADFAIDPADPNIVLATTSQGLQRSNDGGRTFTAVPNEPTLVLLDWPVLDNLVAVDSGGAVYISNDLGAKWAHQGQTPGAPEALATNGTSEIYIATDTGIQSSRDSDRTFTLRQPLN
jgi:photosystem II stability/assembly factor-like uncharacterized protein